MIAKKPSILFLSSWFPTPKHPNLGIFISQQAKAIAQFAQLTVIQVTSTTLQQKKYVLTENTVDGYLHLLVTYRKLNSSIFFLQHLVNFYRFFKSYKILYSQLKIRKLEFEFVQLNVIYPLGFIALWLQRKLNAKLVISEHWSGYLKADGQYKGTVMKWITKRCVNKAKAIIVVSEVLRDSMLAHKLNARYFIVPNSVSNTFDAANGAIIPNKIFQIIHVSTLVDREKNISGLLTTYARFATSKDVCLQVFGGSNFKEKWSKYARELGLTENKIIFHGTVEQAEVAQAMKQANLYVQFSNFETFGCTIVEALHSGLPVISTDVGIAAKIITAQSGRILPVGNCGDLLAALNFYWQQGRNMDRRTVQNSIKGIFEESSVVFELKNIYSIIS